MILWLKVEDELRAEGGSRVRRQEAVAVTPAFMAGARRKWWKEEDTKPPIPDLSLRWSSERLEKDGTWALRELEESGWFRSLPRSSFWTLYVGSVFEAPKWIQESGV